MVAATTAAWRVFLAPVRIPCRRATIQAMGPLRPGGSPADVELRLLTVERARRICERAPGAGDQWAIDFPSEGDREAAGALLRELDRGHPESAFGPYEVIKRASGVVLGGIGFHAPPDAEGAVEIGYGIVDSEAGHGYGTAALVALLELASGLSVRTVRGRALPENRASRRVMEKAGLTFVGISDGYACYYSIALAESASMRHLRASYGG